MFFIKPKRTLSVSGGDYLRKLPAETWYPCKRSNLNPIAVSSISGTSDFLVQLIPRSVQCLQFFLGAYQVFINMSKGLFAQIIYEYIIGKFSMIVPTVVNFQW